MWEAVNDSWIDLRKLDPGDAGGDRLMGFLDWVMSRAVLFNGAAMDTMLRDDAWRFVRLGTMLERADNTARLLACAGTPSLPGAENDAGQPRAVAGDCSARSRRCAPTSTCSATASAPRASWSFC